jgi:putative acetyltransferase
MPTNIRQIRLEDNEPLSKLIKDVFIEFGIDRPGTVYDDPTTDHLFELFQTEKSSYWVAEENGQILGGCGVFPTADLPHGCGELVKFYLSASARGKGIGNLLLQIVLNSSKELDYKQLYLESFPELKNAVKIYRKYSFRKLRKPLGNSGHYACSIWMLREL